LSAIFQSARADSVLRRRRPLPSGTQGSSQLAICQSPRTQRCLRELDVAQQSGARDVSLEQVVAQDPVLGKTSVQRLLEGVDVVNSLADERALVEQVLVDVGNRACVGVDPRLTTVQSRVPGSSRPGQARADARLQDSVAADDELAVGIELRPVQRMRHRADELPGRLAGQFGVRVERDDVARPGERGDVAHHK
jgi:hypothetical protein